MDSVLNAKDVQQHLKRPAAKKNYADRFLSSCNDLVKDVQREVDIAAQEISAYNSTHHNDGLDFFVFWCLKGQLTPKSKAVVNQVLYSTSALPTVNATHPPAPSAATDAAVPSPSNSPSNTGVLLDMVQEGSDNLSTQDTEHEMAIDPALSSSQVTIASAEESQRRFKKGQRIKWGNAILKYSNASGHAAPAFVVPLRPCTIFEKSLHMSEISTLAFNKNHNNRNWLYIGDTITLNRTGISTAYARFGDQGIV